MQRCHPAAAVRAALPVSLSQGLIDLKVMRQRLLTSSQQSCSALQSMTLLYVSQCCHTNSPAALSCAALQPEPLPHPLDDAIVAHLQSWPAIIRIATMSRPALQSHVPLPQNS